MTTLTEALKGDATAEGWCRLDRSWRVLAMGGAAGGLLTEAAGQVLGRCLWDVVPDLHGSVLHRRGLAAMQDGGEQRFLFAHRATGRWYAAVAQPEAASGRKQGLLLRLTDVSAACTDLDDHIDEERMDAAARAVGALAHEINNTLTVIIANAEYLEELSVADGAAMEEIELIAAAADRAAGLTARVQCFARRLGSGSHEVALAPLLRGLASLLSLEAPQWPVRLRLTAGLPPVLAERRELEVCLAELVRNARQAMPSGGAVLISAIPTLDGERVQLVLTDQGRGMSAPMLRRCREPFTRRGRGLGLGLSQVHGFMVSHGGSLRVESDPGGGTSVVLDFMTPPQSGYCAGPEWSVDSQPRSRPAAGVAVPAAGSTVLLVDDDAEGRVAVQRQLGALGFAVATAASAAEALEVLRAGTEPSLLLADIVLPGGLDGHRLAEEVRRTHPMLPVVLMSGYAVPDPGATHDPKMPQLLAKPFRTMELGNALRLALQNH